PGTSEWHNFLFLFLFVTVIIAQINGWIAAIMLGLRKFAILNRMSILSATTGAIGYVTLYMQRDHIPADHLLPAVLLVAAISSGISLAMWIVIYMRTVGLPP